jgi:hypothetical protein
MNKDLKVVLAVIAGAATLCWGGSAVAYLIARQALGQAYATDPAQAAKIGHSIVDYTLPPGYLEQTAASSYGLKVVTIGPQHGLTNSMALALMQVSAEWNALQDDEEAFDPLGEQEWSMPIVSTQTVTIKGQPVILTVREGSDSGGQRIRQASCTFPGRGNATVVMAASGTEDAWDQVALDRFLASIK